MFRQQEIPNLKMEYPGLRFNFEGEAKDTAETGQSMAIGFALGVFGVFVILSFQFRSYLEPFVVLLAIPLALIGVFWGHWLLGHALSMPSIMGFVSLAGVVVNDSILLVQYIRHHVDDGDSVHDAGSESEPRAFSCCILNVSHDCCGFITVTIRDKPTSPSHSAVGDFYRIWYFHFHLTGTVYDPSSLCDFG